MYIPEPHSLCSVQPWLSVGSSLPRGGRSPRGVIAALIAALVVWGLAGWREALFWREQFKRLEYRIFEADDDDR